MCSVFVLCNLLQKWVCCACPKFWKFLPECTVRTASYVITKVKRDKLLGPVAQPRAQSKSAEFPPPPPPKKKPTSSNAPSPNWPLFEKKCRFFATTPWKEKKNADYWKRPFEKKKKKRLEHRQNVSHFDASVVTQVDGSVSHWFVSRCSWSLKKKKDTEEQYIRRTETQKPWSLMLEGRGRLAENLR